MKNFKRLLAIILAMVCLVSSSAIVVSAAKTGSSMISTSQQGYRKGNDTRMYGQTCIEKYITVKKSKVLQIKPQTITNNKNAICNYVRFTIWVYDINTGKRLVNKVCNNNSSITWKNTSKKTAHLSVQVRPYIAQSAFKKFGYNGINAYISSSQYRFSWDNNY